MTAASVASPEGPPPTMTKTPEPLDCSSEKENSSSSPTTTDDSSAISPATKQQQQQQQSSGIQNPNQTKVANVLTPEQRKLFDDWLADNDNNMYPTREVKEMLAEQLVLSYSQVTRLFANQRRRVGKAKPAMTTTTTPPTVSETPASAPCSGPTPTTPTPTERSEAESDVFSPAKALSLVHDDTSTSERSVSPVEEDNHLAALCSGIADELHEAHRARVVEKAEMPITDTPKRRKRPLPGARARAAAAKKARIAAAEAEAAALEVTSPEETVTPTSADEETTPATATSIQVDSEIEPSPEYLDCDEKAETETTSSPFAETSDSADFATLATEQQQLQTEQTNFVQLLTEALSQPPKPLPEAMLADVNPRLVHAMNLLNQGEAWTHPDILSVVLQMVQQQHGVFNLQQQIQQQQQQIQQTRLLANLQNIIQNLTGCPPLTGFTDIAALTSSTYSQPLYQPPTVPQHYFAPEPSTKSTQELLSALSPDEYVAVNALVNLANANAEARRLAYQQQ